MTNTVKIQIKNIIADLDYTYMYEMLSGVFAVFISTKTYLWRQIMCK